MPVQIQGSCVRLLNQTYYQTHLSPPKFVTSNARYAIYFDAPRKRWILADINPKYSMYNIHYYACKYDQKIHHNLYIFRKHPPTAELGWKCIAAHSNTIDITIRYYSNNHPTQDIQLCIFAKQIIVEPNRIIHSGYLLIRNHIIHEVGQTTHDTKLLYNEQSNCTIMHCDILCPGLIDMHTHGIGGHHNVLWYYTNPQYTASKLAKFGTTSFLATVVFSNDCMDDVISMCANPLSRFINKNHSNPNGAICEGIHCEGPIIADFGGLPDSSDSNRWNMAEFERFVDSLNNEGKHHNVKVMTISPSIDYKDNFKRIKLLKQKGIIPAIGHDKQCDEEQIIAALSCINDDSSRKYNFMHMTHCFNVQRFHHREIGLANFALTPKLPKMDKYENIKQMPTIEIIGDLSHVSSILVQSILNCHSPNDLDRIVFITDGIAEPISNKELFYNNRCIHVDDGGRTVKNEKNILCGSCCDMMTIFRNLVHVFNVDIDQAVGMTSTNAATRLGLQHKIGTLNVGTRADVLLMDEKLNLLCTVVNGHIVHNMFPITKN
eukprot:355027_1